MPADRSETYQLQTSSGKWVGGLPIQKGHATIGGKSYPTVKMPDGSVWMAQNLDMSTGIEVVSNYYGNYTVARAAYWEFDQTTYGNRGLFYNAMARYYLQTNASTLFPGWHVPTSSELSNALQNALSNKVLFECFDLTVYGFGLLLDTAPDHGWLDCLTYANTKSYFLQYASNNPEYCLFQYFSETPTGMSGPFTDSYYYKNNVHMPIRLVMDDPTQFVPDSSDSQNTRVQYTKYWRPQVTFEFSESDFNPNRKGLFNSTYGNRNNFQWTKVSDSPNRWRLDVGSKKGVIQVDDPQYGLALLCATNGGGGGTVTGLLTSSQLGSCTCKIVSFGTMDNVETMDRSFMNCTSLTSIPSSIQFGSYVANVAQMFAGCTEVTDGALALYNQLKDVATITNHSDTFKNCGANTQTGLAELQQIPLSWGGMLAPPSTSTTFTRVESKNPKYKWQYNDTNGPDWSTNPVLYIFTDSSLSQYAGINMRKTTTGNIQNGLTSGERYYMPAFVQFDSGSSGAITWVLTTTGYNGHLNASTSAGDMPGTLSYDNFGATDQHFGTYDSSKNVYFCFLVTNVTIDNWGGLTDAYGIQGNNYYQTPITIKWFTA
jgi:hypothetical protein